MQYTKDKQKSLGAFYSPEGLAMLLAKLMLSLRKHNNQQSRQTVLDPATGDSALLDAFNASVKDTSRFSYLGVDVESLPIQNSKALFSNSPRAEFVQTDSLRPFENMDVNTGWQKLMKLYRIDNGFDYIISNPPWGANKSMYASLADEFVLAKGQFDTYDVFLELSLRLLSEGGIYGFIVPDSIYEEQHKELRKMLLQNTSVKYIYRLGEGFFEEVNIGVSLVVGVKEKLVSNTIQCIHLSSTDRRDAIRNGDIESLVFQKQHKISQSLFEKLDYEFALDLTSEDIMLFQKLLKQSVFGMYAVGNRGVELSKKGIVLQCDCCGRWSPHPGAKKTTFKCQSCSKQTDITQVNSSTIVSIEQKGNTVKFIRGEDVHRYKVDEKLYLQTGYEGINYKSPKIYNGDKVVIRKTGVGITASIDTTNSYVNQVVYMYKPMSGIQSNITSEVLLAILCSRVTTYYIIKRYGSNGWRTHAYMTQRMIQELPFPNLDKVHIEDKTIKRIHNIVRDVIKTKKGITPNRDIDIEIAVGKLFGLSKKDYEIIFTTIKNVQRMIPFKALLQINEKDFYEKWDIDILAQRIN